MPHRPRRARWTASDASASRRLASRRPLRGSARVPTSRSGAPVAEAIQAPSSSAAQSCSPPPNGTWTPRPATGASPESTATCAGERSSSSRERRRELRAVEIRRRVDEHEVGLVRGREPDEVAGRVVARERRRPRVLAVLRRPLRTRRRELVLADHEPREHELGRNERGQPDERADPVVPRRCDEHRAGLRRRAARAGLERGILGQDRPLERLQRRRRLDAEALDQRVPRRAVGLERLGLPSGAVQREHLLPAEALAQRVLGDEGLELGDERRMPAEREVGVDPLLERREAQLLEPLAGRGGERLVGEVGERRPAPEVERLAEQRRRRAASSRERARSASAVRRSKRARSKSSSRTRSAYPGGRVSIAAAEPSARRSSETCRCTCVTAETGGRPAYRSSARRSTGTTRFAFSSRIAERRALTRPSEPDRVAVGDDLQRTQHAELEHSSRTVAGR